MKTFRNRITGACLALFLAACADLNVVNQNDPDRERALASARDVESLISGAFQRWWATTQHWNGPAMGLSVAADAHSSSWGNFGMRDMGWEPRKAWDNEPSYNYAYISSNAWRNSYRAMAAVRDGLLAIDGGLRIQEGDGPDDTDRAVAFGTLIQALSLANVAVLYDRGYVIDETVEDVAGVELLDYQGVWAAAEAKFGQVIQLGQAGGFTIPTGWVGNVAQGWSGSYLAEIARSYRARYRTQVARTPAERDGVDWAAVLADAGAGLSADYVAVYTGTGWSRSLKRGYMTASGWGRMDYRTIGPADASGGWERWIAAPPNDKRPFNIDTDDRRVTGATPEDDGLYIEYRGNSPFPQDRGIYHYSHYADTKWDYVLADSWRGPYPEMTGKELEFLTAEAAYRLGDRERAMAIVNRYRAKGELPPFTSASGPAPGGDRCVPQNADGTCGDLFEAMQYEKRLEVFMYGMGTEYFDDRGWGDLVQHTMSQFPIPGSELLLLLLDIYTFGGPGDANAAPDRFAVDFLNDVSPTAIRAKRTAHEAELASLMGPDHWPVRR